MKFLNKVTKTARCCGQIIKSKWKDSKSLFVMEILIGLFQESKAILEMVFPAVIIQLIVDAEKMDKVLFFVFAVSLIMTLLSIGWEMLRRSLSDYSLRALNYQILTLNRHAMNIDLQTFERGETMEQFDRAYDGVWDSSDVDFTIFAVILSKTISFGITAYIFASVHWSVMLVVVATLIIEFVLSVRLSERLHEKDQEQSALEHKKDYVADTIFDCRTNKEIFINHAKDFFVGKYEKVSMEELALEKEKNAITYRNDKIVAWIDFFQNGAVYIVAVRQYMQGLLPLANFTLFTGAAKQMTYAIWQIFQSVSFLLRASDYFDDYLDYMKIDTHDAKTRKAEAHNKKTQDTEEQKTGLTNADTEGTFIEFKNVSFQYPNQNEYAVKNLSFKVGKGQTVALVGDNGAGKSTVIKLLMRLYPVTEGDILVNGKSIYSYSFQEYISCFGPVFQDFMMYAFSLKENLVFDRALDEAALNMLLDNVGLKEKIAQLPKGLDTPYTKRFYEDGVEFSGGEEQKLVIGRALAREAEIMVLDEPTAALDPLAEYSIYELIHKLRKGHTTFFISHRLSTTRFSDKILVLDQGQLVQEGSHETLMEKEGLYQTMFSMQKQYYE